MHMHLPGLSYDNDVWQWLTHFYLWSVPMQSFAETLTTETALYSHFIVVAVDVALTVFHPRPDLVLHSNFSTK